MLFAKLSLIGALLDTKVSYLLLFMWLVLFCRTIFLSNINLTFKNREAIFLYFLPFLICLSWSYGVVVGVINGNDSVYIVSNFFGLLCYVSFFIFVCKPVTKESVLKVIIFCSIFVVLDIFINTYLFFTSGFSVAKGESLSAGRVYMTSSAIIFVPVLAMLLFNYKLIFKRPVSKTLPVITFIFLSIVFIIPAMSKGFILIYLFIVAFWVISKIIRLKYTVSRLISSLCVCVSLFLALLMFLQSEYIELLYHTFGGDNPSNKIRNQQFSFLIEETDAFGSGLGAVLESGYKRDDTGYGFELSFVNLLHKLGVMTLPLFVSYIYVIIQGVVYILKGKKELGVMVLACMSFIIPGAANPMLISPTFVIIHSLIMALIFSEKNKNRVKI